jgi:hypothetical protein
MELNAKFVPAKAGDGNKTEARRRKPPEQKPNKNVIPTEAEGSINSVS